MFLISGTILLSAQTNISYSYDSNGNRYNRKVLVLKSAEASDTTQTEEGVSMNLEEIVLTAFPNPTMGEITITASDNIEQGVIYLYDLSGRSIMTREFSGNLQTYYGETGYGTNYYMTFYYQDGSVFRTLYY